MKQEQNTDRVVRGQAQQPPAPEHRQLRKALRGIEGFEAQAAALIPEPEPGPVADTGKVETEKEEPEATPEQAPTPEPAATQAGAEAEVAQAKIAADQIATQDAAKPAGKGKKKEKKKKKREAGGLKTHGPEEIVATYGTVAEADKRQSNVQVVWVDGLKTIKKGKGKKAKERKTTEEREGIDQMAEPDWDQLEAERKNKKKGKGKKAAKPEPAEQGAEEVEQVPVPKTQPIPVHEKLAPMFQSIFDDIKKSGDWRNILERPWAHNARQNRNKPNEWSVHSWGTAMDVNPTTNPNAPGAKDYSPSARQQSIAKHFTSRGFTWLKCSDAMHFQLHSGGTPKISDAELDAIIADDQLKERDKTYPGTSRASLIRDTKAKIKLKEKELKKVQKLLDKALKKPKPTKAKKLKKHEKHIADLEYNVAKIQWWIGQFQAIVDKLEGKVAAPEEPAEMTPDASTKAQVAGDGAPTSS